MQIQPLITAPRLGLVCITAGETVRYRTITRKRLLSLESPEREAALRKVYAENSHRLDVALDFCNERDIRLYRLPSNLFPFCDEEIGREMLKEFEMELERIGNKAGEYGIRLTVHPDQFVVLSSDRPEVIENSIKVLSAIAGWLDLLKLPRNQYTVMNIHGGKGDRSARLIQVIKNLPDNILSRLTLENDEYAYSAGEILEVCRQSGVAMVFDAHHHVIHEKLDSYDHPSVSEMVREAKKTWRDPEWQLVHISNGKTHFLDPEHSETIVNLPDSYLQVPWIDIEAKGKEKAIDLLKQNGTI